METTAQTLITPAAFLQNWQKNRRLTRKVVDVFPEDKLFSFSVGGMRPFGELVLEMIAMAVPITRGVATGQWSEFKPETPTGKAALLTLWDSQTAPLDQVFATIPQDRFHAVDKAFGQWQMTCIEMLQYAVENEIHHRGQGYVYLRALGIEPPHFWQGE